MATASIRFDFVDQTESGFRELKRRLAQQNAQTVSFNRTQKQQATDQTRFLQTQYRQRVNDRKQQLREETRAATQAARDQVREAERAQREEEQLRRFHQRLVINSRKAEARAAEQSARRQEIALRGVRRAYDSLIGRVSLYASRAAGITLLGAGVATGGVIRTAIQFDQIERGLRAVTGSAQETADALELIRQTAQKPGVDYLQAARSFQQLDPLNLSLKDTALLVQGIGNELTLVGNSAPDSLREISRAFVKVSSSGKITAEDLEIITDRAAGFRDVFQEAFGTFNVAGIREATTDVEDFVSRIITALQTRPQADPDSITNRISNLRNEIQTLGQQLGEAILPRLSDQIQRVSDIIANNGGQIGRVFDQLSNAALSVVDDIINGFELLLQNFDRFVNTIRAGLLAGVGLQLTRFLAGATAGLTSFAASSAAATVSTTGLTASLGRLAPIAATATRSLSILTGVFAGGAAIVAGIELFRFLARDTEILTTRIDQLNDSLDETRSNLASLISVQETISGLTLDTIGSSRATVLDQQADALDQLAQSLGFVTEAQANATIEELRAQGLQGRTGSQRRQRIQDLRERIRSEGQLREITEQRIESLEIQRSLIQQGGASASNRRRDINAEIRLRREQLDLQTRLNRSLEALNQQESRLLFNIPETTATAPTTTSPTSIRSSAGRLTVDLTLDLRDPIDLEVLRGGLNRFEEETAQTRDRIRENLVQPFVALDEALSNVRLPEQIQAEIDNIPSPLLIDVDVENRAVDSVFENIQEQTNRIADVSLDELLRAEPTPAREVQAPILSGFDIQVGEALSGVDDLRDDLRQRYDDMVQDSLNLSSRIESSVGNLGTIFGRLATDIAGNLSNIRESYRDWARDVIRSIAGVVAAEVQAATARLAIQQITPFITTALVGVSPGAQIGIGLAAVAGLQTLASSFHNPLLDRSAQRAGFAQASREFQSNPVAYGEQSGQDLISNYETGFQQGLRTTGNVDGQGGNVINLTLETPIEIDGNEIAKAINSYLINLDDRNRIIRRN